MKLCPVLQVLEDNYFGADCFYVVLNPKDFYGGNNDFLARNTRKVGEIPISEELVFKTIEHGKFLSNKSEINITYHYENYIALVVDGAYNGFSWFSLNLDSDSKMFYDWKKIAETLIQLYL